MPTLGKFYGIQITIRPSEGSHVLPHFHARYAEFNASIAIGTIEVLAGSVPGRAMEMVMIWGTLHRAELQAAWEALQSGRLPAKIEPLQ